MPTPTTTLTAEGYVQTLGATDPAGYLEPALAERVARGELWQLGRYYAAVAAGQEITPLLQAHAAVIANLGDGSALLAPGLVWSVAEDAELSAGARMTVGARPGPEVVRAGEDVYLLPAAIRSEFGLYPSSLFLRIATYF